MAEKIRIKNITNSLYQMEKWARYLRLALSNMDPSMLVSTDDDVVPSPGLNKIPPRLAMGCPPSQPDPVQDDGDDDDDGKKHPKKGKHKGSGKGGGKKKAAHK